MSAPNSIVAPALGLFQGAVWHLAVGVLAFVAGVFLEHQRSSPGTPVTEVATVNHHDLTCPMKALFVEAVVGAREGLTQQQLLARLKRKNAELQYPVTDPDLLENLSYLTLPLPK